MHSPSQSDDFRSEHGDDSLSYMEGVYDLNYFKQVIEMDEIEADFSRKVYREFYKSAYMIVDTWNESLGKAEEYLKLLHVPDQSSPEVLDRKLGDELEQISRKGHELKGSSATLGMIKVTDSCGKIQHLGARRDETGSFGVSSEEAVRSLKAVVPLFEAEFKEAQELSARYHGIRVLNVAQIIKEEDDEAKAEAAQAGA